MRASAETQAAGLLALAPRARERRRPRASGGASSAYRLAVTSGKGGVGKSQIAANLAIALAKRGRRVLIVDADVGLASQDLVLGCAPPHDIMDVLSGRASLDEALVSVGARVDLLPACPGRYEMANLSLGERARLLGLVDEAGAAHDVVVVDTGAGIGSNAVDFVVDADEALVVVSPDPTSLRDAYAMIKVLDRRGGVQSALVVTNQVDDVEGASVFARLDDLVRRFLGVRLEHVGSVPRDRAVRDATLAGQPFVVCSPRAQASQAIARLSSRVDTLVERYAGC